MKKCEIFMYISMMLLILNIPFITFSYFYYETQLKELFGFIIISCFMIWIIGYISSLLCMRLNLETKKDKQKLRC